MIKQLLATVVFLLAGPAIAAPEAFLMWRPDTNSQYQRKSFTPVENYVLSFDADGIPTLVPFAVVSGDGDVVGPASSANGRVATFSGTTGKLIADSGFTIADLRNASNLNAGTLPAARMPVPTTTTLGGVKRNTGSAGQYVTGIDAAGELLYDTPGGATITVPDNRVPYGDGGGNLVSEAGYEYDAGSNLLTVPNVQLSGQVQVGGATGPIFYSPAADHFGFTTDGTGDDLNFDLDTDNAARVYSLAGVGSITFDGIDLIVPTEAYDATNWNGDNSVPTKDAVRDKLETFAPSVTATHVPYGSGDGVLTSEAAFTYDAALNLLGVDGVYLGGSHYLNASGGNLILSNGVSAEDWRINVGQGAANTVRFSSGTGVNKVDFENTQLAQTASALDNPSAMGALAVDLTKKLNTKSASGNQSITFSGSLENGEYSELRWENTAATTATISWAVDVYDANTGALVPNLTVPARIDVSEPGRRHVVFGSDGTNMLIYQGGGGGGVSSYLDLTDIPAIIDDIGDLTDPGADRIGFWDDSAGIFTWLELGSGLSISTTTLSAPGFTQTGTFTGTGTYNADTVYSGTMSAAAAVTMSLAAGQWVTYNLDVTGSTRTLSGFTAYRVGYSGGTITTLDLPVGRHRVHFYHDGTNLTVMDSVAEQVAISTDISGLGTGVATFLGTPSSANLRSALTDENGTGAAVFSGATNPAFTNVTYTNAAISALDIDWAAAGMHHKTLSANSTFTFSNVANGMAVTVALTNTASNYTVTWPTVTWKGGVTPTQTIGAKTDIYTFIRINGVTYGSAIQDF